MYEECFTITLESIQSNGDNMKSDFTIAKEELNRIGIMKICLDFYIEPKKKGSVFFTKSPSTSDKTFSLALYPSSNRFCDFANGNYSGDVVGFVSYIKGINNWQALKELQAFYGLANAKKLDRQEIRRRIRLQQEQERQKEERYKAFYQALWGEIDRLKRWENIYKVIIKKQIYVPFTNEWCYCIKEQQKINLQLDILCAVDSKVYARMKPNPSIGLSSDRPQWLLDTLAILAEYGSFKATKTELQEITAQRDFELTRKSETDRRCSIKW